MPNSMSENKSVMVLGERITTKAGEADTQKTLSAFEIITPPGGGAPPHIHSREDETFYVVEGSFEITVGADTIPASAGSFVYGPRHVPHHYKNVGAQPARMLVTFLPTDLEGFFIAMSELPQEGPPDFQAIAALMHRYGIEIVLPPIA